MNRLETALRFAVQGFRIFPQNRNKRSCIKSWPNKASSDPEQIRKWAKQFPKANFAVVTGQVSGFIAVDIDIKNDQPGRESLKALQRQCGQLPDTLVVRTGSGGGHLYFKLPDSVTLICSGPLKGYPGIEIRAEAVCATLPGSIYADGREYVITVDSEIAVIPPTLIRLLQNQRQQSAITSSIRGNGEKHPENWQNSLLENVPEGERHTRMVQLCGRWYGKGLNEQEVLSVAYGANTRWTKPLPEKELAEIVRTLKQTHDRKHPLAGPGEPVKDYGHAAVLAQHFTGHFRWAPHRGKWMSWNGRVWKPAEEEWVAKRAADTLRKEYAAQLGGAKDKYTVGHLLSLVKETCTYARVIAALSFLKGWDGILTRTEEWDADPWVLNCLSGIIDLHTKHLSKHDPDRLITKMTPVVFNPEAPGDGWQEHLKLFLPDEAVRRQVQRDLGVSLVGTDIVEMLPIWLGGGLNGKTTTAKVLRKILGDYVGEAAPNLLIQTKFERHPTELADLAGRRIVFSSEVGQGKRLDEEIVKRLTGGDVKKGRFMRGDFFDIEQTFTIFMIVNHRPGISGTDHAIWRRVRLIPWTVQIPEAKKLPQDEIVDSLVAEGSAVLSWLLAGLADWQQDRGWMAPEVKAVTAAYRAEQDRLGAFLSDACEEAQQYTISVADLYEAYTSWCQAASEDPLGKTSFSRRLKERGKTSKKTGHDNVTTWFGLRLRHIATPSTVSPIENNQSANKQVKHVAICRKNEQIDTEKGIRQNDLDLKATPKKGEFRI